MTVCLVNVKRNLNRAYRVASAFGVDRLDLVDCGEIGERLFGATGTVKIERRHGIPVGRGVVALETWGYVQMEAVAWPAVDTILVGGETDGLPRYLQPVTWVRIPQVRTKPGLTVEAALAIALYVWRRACPSV